MKKQHALRVLSFATLASGLACSTPSSAPAPRAPAFEDPSVVMSLPSISPDEQFVQPFIIAALEKAAARDHLTPEQMAQALQRVTRYVHFLGITRQDLEQESRGPTTNTTPAVRAALAANPNAPSDGGDDVGNNPPPPEGDAEGQDDDKSASRIGSFTRLAASSMQFLNCDDFTDWACLERHPLVTPTAKYRQETDPSLGTPVDAGPSLEIEGFFTDQWDRAPDKVDLKRTVALQLAQRIQNFGTKGLLMALYGIDDINGSMKPVFDAISAVRAKAPQDVRAVVDFTGVEPAPKPWTFTYVAPPSNAGPEAAASWIFGPATSGIGTHLGFQYDGTPNLFALLDRGAANDGQSLARLEWPASHIMHNKFLVMRGEDDHLSVWSGTANLSNHCMGTERNSNMSVFIHNDFIARAYMDEFTEMFNFDPSVRTTSSKVVGPGGQPIPVGRFHRNKLPNTHRYFRFDDGTEARVHFAPTDDAEHRVIIPMLLSARPGDIIRISMFGGAGYEIVRAIQYAAARGADVRIVFDARLGSSPYSWLRAVSANLAQPNPYIGKVDSANIRGRITVHFSTWEGKNHHKSATLSRHLSFGRHRPELLIVGSQNWSSGGNDYNDENLLSIQNLRTPLPIIQQYNNYFDRRLWKESREIKPH